MRIISGIAKGRRLKSPPDDDVRPTIDRVKESIFNMINMHIQDAVVLDLFSGTGNLALEAISRGAKKAYLVDKSRKSLKIIKENIQTLGFHEECHVIEGDFKKIASHSKERFDIIFLDPPYNKGLINESIGFLLKNDRLNHNGIIVAEHINEEPIEESPDKLEIIKQKRYGIMTVTIYKKLE